MVAIVLAAALAVSLYAQSYFVKTPMNTSVLTGAGFIAELLDPDSHRRVRSPLRRIGARHTSSHILLLQNIYDTLGVNRHVFFRLRRELITRTASSAAPWRATAHVGADEHLCIFLYICRQGTTLTRARHRLQRSVNTISKCVRPLVTPCGPVLTPSVTAPLCRSFRRTLAALTSLEFYQSYISLPSSSALTPSEISSDPKRSPFFNKVRCAIDGTHMKVHPAAEDRPRYRNRKGTLSINILAACTFDMRFTYLLSGYEGSACDSAIWSFARTQDLQIPQGQRWLGNAGFGICDALYVPYRATRYHLKEWAKGNKK